MNVMYTWREIVVSIEAHKFCIFVGNLLHLGVEVVRIDLSSRRCRIGHRPVEHKLRARVHPDLDKAL